MMFMGFQHKVSYGIGVKYMRADMGYDFSRWENTVVVGVGMRWF